MTRGRAQENLAEGALRPVRVEDLDALSDQMRDPVAALAFPCRAEGRGPASWGLVLPSSPAGSTPRWPYRGRLPRARRATASAAWPDASYTSVAPTAGTDGVGPDAPAPCAGRLATGSPAAASMRRPRALAASRSSGPCSIR